MSLSTPCVFVANGAGVLPSLRSTWTCECCAGRHKGSRDFEMTRHVLTANRDSSSAC